MDVLKHVSRLKKIVDNSVHHIVGPKTEIAASIRLDAGMFNHFYLSQESSNCRFSSGPVLSCSWAT